MKKRERRTLKQVLSKIFDFRMWIGTDGLKSFWYFIVSSFKKMFVPNATKSNEKKQETFVEAQERLGLTEETLLVRQKTLFRTSVFLTICGVLLLIYTLFQLFNGSFLGFLLTFSVTGLAFAMAFRYHFWFFQIKERKLGCSVREWYRHGVRGEK